MKKHASNVFLVLIFVVGLSLLLYPSFSEYWNSLHQSEVIASYSSAVAQIEDDRYDDLWEEARQYNADLAAREDRWKMTPEQMESYLALLDVTQTGIMGYIEIPSIGCALPIYHTTDTSVLQVAVGHMEGSSLPVGGESTHCVLTGHRGLPSARLFTDIDKLSEGDVFLIQMLDDTLTYEVDQILIVLPYDVEALEIEEGKDYCTLVTCTPYGVNSHRLLVRGHRVETQETKTVRVTADAAQIEPLLIAPMVAAPILLVLLAVLMVTTRRRR